MNNTLKSTKTLLWVEVASSPDREAAKKEYLQKAGPITAKHGGQPPNTFKMINALGQRNALQLAVLFSFPDEQAIHNLFSDPEYVKLLPIRAKAFLECRYTVKDFGTSKSPKSTRKRDNLLCPSRPASVPLRYIIASSMQAP